MLARCGDALDQLVRLRVRQRYGEHLVHLADRGAQHPADLRPARLLVAGEDGSQLRAHSVVDTGRDIPTWQPSELPLRVILDP